jgi:hypothetical protein
LEKYKFFKVFGAMCQELVWHPLTVENIGDAIALVEKAEEEVREVRQKIEKRRSQLSYTLAAGLSPHRFVHGRFTRRF